MRNKRTKAIQGQMNFFNIISQMPTPKPAETPKVAPLPTQQQVISLFDYFGNSQPDEAKQIAPTISAEPQKKKRIGTNFRLSADFGYAVSVKERYLKNIAAIRTLKEIEAADREATPDEQTILGQYTGWGGAADVFDAGRMETEHNELAELLDKEEFRAARESVLSAFYTPSVIIQTIWQQLVACGFKCGNVLEPSCGTGRFIGLMPEDIKANVYGVELDSISARIAAILYPQAEILSKGFEKTTFEDNFFDVVIGNIPFGEYAVPDRRYDGMKLKIHDYFIVKSLDLVRPGGVVALVATKGVMDKNNEHVRRVIGGKADLVGAVRLPEDAFPGTRTTADILFLQKKEKAGTTPKVNWTGIGTINGDVPVNQYYTDRPDMMLGNLVWDSRYDGHSVTTLVPSDDAWIEKLKDRMGWRFTTISDNGAAAAAKSNGSQKEIIPAAAAVKNFTFTVVDGAIYFRRDSIMELKPFAPRAKDAIMAYIRLRDAVHAVLGSQMHGKSDKELEYAQAVLSRQYDAFIKKFSHVTSKYNKTRFHEDADYPLVASLEITEDTGSVSKADIFFKRTIKQHHSVDHVDTAAESLPVSLDVKGRVDLEYMSHISKLSKEKIIADLIGIIFQDPEGWTDGIDEVWVTADEYLSGNVRQKLKIAEEMAAKYPERFVVNMTELRKAQPTDLNAADIDLRLGAVWIDEKYITDFIHYLLHPNASKDNLHAVFVKQNATWCIEGAYGGDLYSIASTKTYGTDRMNAYQIIEETLNLRTIKVVDYVENEKGNKVARANVSETISAQEKQGVIKEVFRNWVYDDSERRADLTRTYNNLFNTTRLREYNGSFLSFPGMSAGITLEAHQKNAAARSIMSLNALLAHVVGAGKTWTMAAAAMEMRRLGIIHKPMFVVPNHLTEQWGSDFLRLYPSANIMVATKDDFTKEKRLDFCARIATGNYDAIIIGHNAFGRIPVSQEMIEGHIEEQKAELETAIAEAKGESDSYRTVRALEIDKKRIENRLAKLVKNKKRDIGVTFEELGVDYLFVDEAHYFKNLFLYTKMRNVAGVGSTDSQKSSDLFMKIQYLQERYNGRAATFATGTPVSNSMTELYTMQRYLQPNELAVMGMEHFDCWASTFGEQVTTIELAPEGTGYRSKTRFARFFNLPELMKMFCNIADIQTAKMLDLPRPALNGGKIQNIVGEASEIQKRLVQELGHRAEAIRKHEVEPYVDNMLKVTTDGRALALDQRLMNPHAPDDPNSKVNRCVANVFSIWKETSEKRLTQLIFCDLSTPKTGKDRLSFSVYADIKGKLIRKGIPKNEIAFIHDANTDLQKKELFAKMRAGVIRILLGSTQKMGAGTNVQKRLIALHHIDVPWRPSDLEQREGRILRRGNDNPEVMIFRYVTSGTFDSYSWQIIENKQRFISQIMAGETTIRSADDIDESALSYAEVKALATGNPLFKEKMDVDIQVNRLQVLEAAYKRNRYEMEDSVERYYPATIRKLLAENSGYEADMARRDEATGERFSMALRGTSYTIKEEADLMLAACAKNVRRDDGNKLIGQYRGFDILIESTVFDTQPVLRLRGTMTYEVGAYKIAGNVAKFDMLADGIENLVSKNKESIEELRVRIEQMKEELKKPFQYQMQLAQLIKRQNELNAQLNLDKHEDELGGEQTA